MKLKKFTYPVWFYPPIVTMDYSGLNAEDRRALNNALLMDGVLFCDCVKTSKEYQKLISGVYCMVMDFYFKEVK